MASPNFAHVQCRMDQGVLVVTLLDENLNRDDVAENLRKELLVAAEHYRTPHWIVDFARVQFLTSSAIRPLLTLHRKLQSDGGRLVLCNLRSAIAEVFHATRLLATPGSPPGPFEAASNLELAMRCFKHHFCRIEDGVLVLTMTEKELRGEEMADTLKDEMFSSWDDLPSRAVIVDLKNVEMITTPCIRTLLQLRTHVKEKGGQVALCSLTPQVSEIFSVTRLISVVPDGPSLFSTYSDVPAALATLKRTS